MKILLISSFLPYPLYSGGHIRLYNIIKELSVHHEITLVCEKRAYQTEQDIEAVKKYCKEIITVDRKKQWSAGVVLQTIFSANSFLITGHTLPEMRERISALLTHHSYDVIHCETSYVMQNIPSTTIPVVLVEHNIEYTIYDRFVKQKGFPVRPLLGIDVAKLKRNEESFWKKATISVAVSPPEEKVIAKKAKKTALVSNGVDLAAFSMKHISFPLQNKKLLYIGDFSYIQNQDAAMYLLKEIYPKIKERDVANEISLWIVGRKIPDAIKHATNDSSVMFDEHATQPTAEIFSASAALIAPLRVGGGTQYKILESLAVGTPVITTRLGRDGLDVENGRDILIAETPETLANVTYDLLQDEKLYTRLATNGRKLIEATYSWKTIAKALEQVYKTVVQ